MSHQQPLFSPRRGRALMLLLCLLPLALFSGCTYKDRVAPLDLPDPDRGAVVVEGVKIAALSFADPEKARNAFGFDARRAGLLPVQLTFQNDGTVPIYVNPEQTFLIDRQNRAWPILSLEKAQERTSRHVEVGETLKETGKPALLLGAAGAVAGAALAILTGDNVGAAAGKGAAVGAAAGVLLGGAKGYMDTGGRIQRDLTAKTLGGSPILPNQIGYGALFFPGIVKEEADGAEELRLSLTIGGQTKIIRLPLQ